MGQFVTPSITKGTRSRDWREALLPASATIQQAIGCLNTSALQIVMVITPTGTLVGTITDGDIRRGLLRGLVLSSPIDTILHRDALVVPPTLTRETVLSLMQANEIHALPVVDADRVVVGLHVLNELLAPKARPNPMVIMAGGSGTRLLPHTELCPKPLLPVAGKPMLEHIVERARADGFRHFIMAVHYLSHMIEEYFGDGQRWDVHVEYVREDTPLGTAGALGQLQPAPDEAFVVTNGDVLTDIRYGDLLDYHCRQTPAATMAVRVHEWQHPFGVVRTSGVDITGFEEKPIARTHVNAGIYALAPAALRHLAAGERCDMTTLFARLQAAGERTIVYPMHELWADLGLPDDLERVRSLGLSDGR